MLRAFPSARAQHCTTTAASRRPPISYMPPAPCPLLPTNALLSAHAGRRWCTICLCHPAPASPACLSVACYHSPRPQPKRPPGQPGGMSCPCTTTHPARYVGSFCTHPPLSTRLRCIHVRRLPPPPTPGLCTLHTANLPRHLRRSPSPCCPLCLYHCPACALATQCTQPHFMHGASQLDLYCNTSSALGGGEVPRHASACLAGWQRVAASSGREDAMQLGPFPQTALEHQGGESSSRRKASAACGDPAAGAAAVTSWGGRALLGVLQLSWVVRHDLNSSANIRRRPAGTLARLSSVARLRAAHGLLGCFGSSLESAEERT